MGALVIILFIGGSQNDPVNYCPVSFLEFSTQLALTPLYLFSQINPNKILKVILFKIVQRLYGKILV